MIESIAYIVEECVEKKYSLSILNNLDFIL